MSGFVKRNRAVDTVNPAGGINPALEPNVGQYGWTTSDSAHVNQLIAYVDASRKFSEAVQEGVLFVKDKTTQVSTDADKVSADRYFVTNAATQVKEDLSSVEASKAHVDLSLGVVLDVRDDMHSLYEEMVLSRNSLKNQIEALEARVKALEDKNP